MNFWEYTLCLACMLSFVRFMQQVFDDAFRSAPLSVFPREVLLILTVPATMGLFALPVYGFFIMPWWKPIAGFALAIWLAHLVHGQLLRGTKHAYSWAIVFSLATTLGFAGTVLI
jgi:hypothetical protein